MIRMDIPPIDPTIKKTTAIHWAWVILAISFANLFVNYSVRLGYGVVLPEMIQSLGLTRTAGGSIYNAYLFTYILLTPLTGLLTDRFGARPVISACGIILSLGVLLMGTTRTLWTACLFYAVVGIGATGMWAPVITVVQRWFDSRRRGLALGIMSTGYGFGFAAMGAVFPWIVRHFDWRYAWYILGFAALAMVVVNSVLLRSDPESAGFHPWGRTDPDKSSPLVFKPKEIASRRFSAIFTDMTFWKIGLSYFCISYALYGITTFMVDYARTQMGIPMEKASLLATVHGFAQVAGVLTVLPLSDRLGRRNMILVSNGFITVSLVGILMSRSPGLLYGMVGLLAIFYGATFPIYGACAGDYFPKAVMGTVIGAWTPFYGAGAILSHWVTGWLRDTTGAYDFAFMLNTTAAALGFVLFLLVRVKHRRSP